MPIEKNRIRLLFYTFTISVVVILIVLLSMVFINAYSNQSALQLAQLESSILDMKKAYVKDLVDTTIQNITIERDFLLSNETESLTTSTNTLVTLLSTKATPLEMLERLTYEYRLNPHTQLLIFNQITQSIEVSRNVESKLMSDLTSAGLKKAFSNLAIYNYIEDDTYLILLGINSKYIDDTIKATMIYRIRQQSFIDDGYIWINQIRNYSGGDDYAIRLVHPNLPESEGELLSTNTEDSEGNKPYKLELEGINANGYLYNDYYFKKMNDDKVAHKLSYAALYAPYDWVIATGVYLDDVDVLIENESASMIGSLAEIKIKSLIISIVAIILSVSLLVLFEQRITKLIITFQNTVNEKNIKIMEEMAKIEEIAYLDPLTGILNRRAMIKRIEESLSRSKRYDESFSIGLVDIDNFKEINDTYGHGAGDLILKGLTEILSNNTRRDDAVARWGGEEFLLLLNHTDYPTANTKFNHIRQLVEEAALSFEGHLIPCTISLGFTLHHNDIDHYEELIQEADNNLYIAKESGKNKVVGP